MRDTTATDLIDGKDEFVVYTPGVVDIIDKAGTDIETERPIGGWCSTERLDRQGETVLARGLDFTEFVQHGYYNDNHKQETSAILGVPRTAELKKGRWYTEGNLIQGYEPADRVWALAKALRKSALGRKLGFSIEGKVTERGTGGRIVRATIRHVAITNSPVNVDCTWDILTKAFGSHDEIAAASLRRAVAVGYQGPAHHGAGALTEESLEGDQKIERDTKTLTFDDAVKRIKAIRPNYSKSQCERLARIIFTLEERRK